MPSNVYPAFRDSLVQLQMTVGSMTWGKQQQGVAGCHFAYGDGFLCRVRRWDAAVDIESGRPMGRLQCWTDDWELETDFLETHPEFRTGDDWHGSDGAYFLGPSGDGEHCLLEVSNSILIVGSEVDHDYVLSNVFGQVSSHGEGGWMLSQFFEEYGENVSVERLALELIEFATDAACSWGNCPKEDQTDQ